MKGFLSFGKLWLFSYADKANEFVVWYFEQQRIGRGCRRVITPLTNKQ